MGFFLKKILFFFIQKPCLFLCVTPLQPLYFILTHTTPKPLFPESLILHSCPRQASPPTIRCPPTLFSPAPLWPPPLKKGPLPPLPPPPYGPQEARPAVPSLLLMSHLHSGLSARPVGTQRRARGPPADH